jgi:hypothetical protein
MNRLALDRRRFLKLAGATALTYPFLRGVPSYAAGGSGNGPYLVLLFSGCGVVRFEWGAQGAAPTGTTGSAVTSPLVFRKTLSAFTQAGPMKADLTSKVIVLDGLSNKAAGQGTHESGMASLWTGQSVQTSGTGVTGASIDQAIAPLLSSQLNIARPYPTISLMAQSSADYPQRQVDTRMLYDSSGNWVDPYVSPSAALAALFPSAMSSASSSSGPDKMALIRQKVAAQVNADLTAIQGRLCNDDKAQLQNFQDLYNTVLSQITNAQSAAASCTAPSIGGSSDAGAGADPFPLYVQAMSNILAMALACDLTRVASLQLSHALSPVTHTWLGSDQNQSHHSFSHTGPSWLGSLGTDLYNEPSSVTSTYPTQLIAIDAWYAQQVANLAYTMSQLTSGSGTLLDQSVICWGSEIDMGAAHNHDDTPFVLIGGGAGKLKTNQLVRFPLTLGNSAQNDASGFRFHNDLLLTLAQVMGVSLPGNTFGTASLCTGPIQEILA